MALGTLTVTKRYTSGPLAGITVTDTVTNFDTAYPAYGDAPENIVGQTFYACLTMDSYIVEGITLEPTRAAKYEETVRLALNAAELARAYGFVKGQQLTFSGPRDYMDEPKVGDRVKFVRMADPMPNGWTQYAIVEDDNGKFSVPAKKLTA